ncbi:Uncharacterised protein [Legionella cincinnatiensis]|uniref:Uncharacterized protein n=2 Tax=Legionella cincinnatiensis TaxID=28085 RepID=A0A378IJK0_9GAMM|nr:hypothetical protein Lcin_3149 [Legionella cincinnatiensis]STX34865.1 Uncharacterised protein [Legionella cincinnatiensis]
MVYENMFSKLLKGISLVTAGYMTHKLMNEIQREHAIKTKEGITHCEDLVKAPSEFEEIGKPIHGTLSSSYVRHKETGQMYVKKGAHSREDIVKELMISNALHEIRKEQPECLIMQTKNRNGFQYHTLSRKFDNTQDVEEFVRQGKTDELKKKQAVGLEETLITDHIIGKQSDTKLANMIVRDDGDKLIFTTIDNERAVTPTGLSFFHPTSPTYPINKLALIRSIHDLSEKSDDNQAGLAGDPRAKEFGELAESVMENEKIDNYYQKLARTNLDPVIDQCNRLAKASNNGLVKQSDCVGYQLFFKEMQKRAGEQIENSKIRNTNSV